MGRRRNKPPQATSTTAPHADAPESSSSSSRDSYGYKMPRPMKKLPFALKEAAENPWKYGAQVDAFVCEKLSPIPWVQLY